MQILNGIGVVVDGSGEFLHISGVGVVVDGCGEFFYISGVSPYAPPDTAPWVLLGGGIPTAAGPKEKGKADHQQDGPHLLPKKKKLLI